MGEGKKLRKRSEIDDKFKWAIEDLYGSDEEWRAEFDQVKEMAGRLTEYKGRLSESADTLLNFLSFSDEISMLEERVYVYANQRYHEDTGNAVYQDLSDKASNLSVYISGQSSFAVPEILEMPSDVIEDYLNSDNGIQVYKIYIDEILRKKDHVLTAEMEELLANTGEVCEAPKNIFSMFNNADIKFADIKDENGEEVSVTHGRFYSFLVNRDRRVRKDAFESVYSTYDKFKNTLAATFSANIKKDIFYAKARKYPSTIAMRLNGSNVPISVYDNLIEAVHENLPLLHRYVALRKRVLGLDELHMYDLYLPMVSDLDKKIDFEEAKNTVMKGLEPLGEVYQSILREGFENRWIDIYENEGKRSGAYSWGAYGTHPYVLMNYEDNINNLFTLAHEMGHAIHSYSSDEAQPYVYAGYKIFVAEVASTCNEALVMEHLLENTTDKKEKAYLINYFLEQFRSTLYRQVMFAEFEKKVHQMAEEGIGLTSESLSQVYYD